MEPQMLCVIWLRDHRWHVFICLRPPAKQYASSSNENKIDISFWGFRVIHQQTTVLAAVIRQPEARSYDIARRHLWFCNGTPGAQSWADKLHTSVLLHDNTLQWLSVRNAVVFIIIVTRCRKNTRKKETMKKIKEWKRLNKGQRKGRKRENERVEREAERETVACLETTALQRCFKPCRSIGRTVDQ